MQKTAEEIHELIVQGQVRKATQSFKCIESRDHEKARLELLGVIWREKSEDPRILKLKRVLELHFSPIFIK
jgi:hypothetical protein